MSVDTFAFLVMREGLNSGLFATQLSLSLGHPAAILLRTSLDNLDHITP